MENHRCPGCNNNLKIYPFVQSTVTGRRSRTLRDALNEPKFDLELMFCESCGLLSQRKFESADLLLDELYTQHESTQHSAENHFLTKMAEDIKHRYGLTEASKVLEVGCNCGFFLAELNRISGAKVKGIEPSRSLVHVWEQRNLDVINGYLERDMINQFGSEKFDVIYFRHVLEHIPNIYDFCHSVSELLKKTGAVVVEVPDLELICERRRYENMSYSHLHYFSRKSLEILFEQFNLFLRDFEYSDNDGGSIICFFEAGEGEVDITQYPNLCPQVEKLISDIPLWKHSARESLIKARELGSIVGYGAGAKGQHLIHLLGLPEFLDFVIDDTPGFPGHFIPGTSLQIASRDRLSDSSVATVVNLAPTHLNVIRKKAASNHGFIDFINNVDEPPADC